MRESGLLLPTSPSPVSLSDAEMKSADFVTQRCQLHLQEVAQ